MRRARPYRESPRDVPDPDDPTLYPRYMGWPEAWARPLYSHSVSDADPSDYVVVTRTKRGGGLERVVGKTKVSAIVDQLLVNDGARAILLERLAEWSADQNRRADDEQQAG